MPEASDSWIMESGSHPGRPNIVQSCANQQIQMNVYSQLEIGVIDTFYNFCGKKNS